MVALVILVFILVAFVSYAVVLYNGLLRVAAGVKLAWSNIDVLLVQRTTSCRSSWRCAGNTCSTRATLWNA